MDEGQLYAPEILPVVVPFASAIFPVRLMGISVGQTNRICSLIRFLYLSSLLLLLQQQQRLLLLHTRERERGGSRQNSVSRTFLYHIRCVH